MSAIVNANIMNNIVEHKIIKTNQITAMKMTINCKTDCKYKCSDKLENKLDILKN